MQGTLNGESWKQTASMTDARPQAGYLPRLWAKRHLDELLKSGPEHKEEIVSLSKQYYVVTPHTSLIVLENDDMYKEYKVERGRKDHWALYPAPKKIDVVKEPIDWARWGWSAPGADASIKAQAQPKSVKEIVDSVQLRINAPFYYWQPQSGGESRLAMYHLLDADVEASRLLMFAFGAAADDREGVRSLQGGDPTEPEATKEKEKRKRQLMQSVHFVVPTGLVLPDQNFGLATGFRYVPTVMLFNGQVELSDRLGMPLDGRAFGGEPAGKDLAGRLDPPRHDVWTATPGGISCLVRVTPRGAACPGDDAERVLRRHFWQASRRTESDAKSLSSHDPHAGFDARSHGGLGRRSSPLVVAVLRTGTGPALVADRAGHSRLQSAIRDVAGRAGATGATGIRAPSTCVSQPTPTAGSRNCWERTRASLCR